MNIVTISIMANLVLVLYIAWLKRRMNRLTKDNENNKRALLQKELQIDALERREMIEINNQYDARDLNERLRAKGYLSPKF